MWRCECVEGVDVYNVEVYSAERYGGVCVWRKCS